MGDCKKCPFYKTEPVPEDLAGKVNLTEWLSCDVDAVGLPQPTGSPTRAPTSRRSSRRLRSCGGRTSNCGKRLRW